MRIKSVSRYRFSSFANTLEEKIRNEAAHSSASLLAWKSSYSAVIFAIIISAAYVHFSCFRRRLHEGRPAAELLLLPRLNHENNTYEGESLYSGKNAQNQKAPEDVPDWK